MRVDIFDVAAIDQPDEEGVIDADGVDLDIDIDLDEPSVLFVGVGGEMHSWYVSEGCLVVRVDIADLEPIFE